jgi:DNA-binding transcriptional ArsR family regulator
MQNCDFSLNNSATLNIYINPQIFDSIIKILVRTDEMRSLMLYNKLVNELKKHFSYTTFDNHLKRLIEIGYVNKRKETSSNYNISPIYYSLTNKGKKDYNLEILEISHLINKNRILYQLLLFFDCYKRSNILSERQFKNFLKKIGIKFENMEQMDLETLKHIQQNIFSNLTNGYRTYNNISIGEYRNFF